MPAAPTQPLRDAVAKALQAHLDRLFDRGEYDPTGFSDARSGWLELEELSSVPDTAPWEERSAHKKALRDALGVSKHEGRIEHRSWGGEYGNTPQWRALDSRVKPLPPQLV